MQPDLSDLTSLTDLITRTRRAVTDGLRLAGHALGRVERFVIDLGNDSRAVARDATALWRTVEEAAAEASATWRATPRVARILSELSRLAAVYRLHHIESAWVSEARAAERLEALHAREAARMTATLETLGGGLLKVGQLLSSRADLLPAAWIAELKRLQDQVPPAPEAEVQALLAEELQALWPREPAPDDAQPLSPWLVDFDPTPLAAASIAQVHRARLADRPDALVALKVQRPGIAELIAQDRKALALIAELVAPWVETFALGPVLTEVSRSLVQELDFTYESAMAERFAKALSPALATVPTIHARTSRLIVMDFVDGERLVPFLDANPGAERERVLERLARTTAEAILVRGLVHADPHPGNFLVRETAAGPELVLLDFGAALTLSDRERRATVELLVALFGKNEAKVAELLAELGFSAPDPEAPAKFALGVASALTPSDLLSIDPRVELERALALARLYPGLVVPASFVHIGRALAGLGGLFMHYRPTLDLGRVLFDALARASHAS